MQIRIVRRYRAPGYPTREYLVEHPELLRYVPQRWRGNRLVLGLLGLAVPLLAARHAWAGDAKSAPAGAPHVAPLFIHGDGRGAFGCVAVNPPTFLTEDEARQVVQDEAKKAGLNFVTNALTLKGSMVPVTDRFSFAEEHETRDGQKKKSSPAKLQKRDLVLDGYDKAHDVAYQVVTQEDFAQWERQDRGMWCSVSSYDFKAAAQGLTNGLSRAGGKTVVGVFYEPGGRVSIATERQQPREDATDAEWQAFWKKQQAAGRKIGEQELRAQVQDFVKWLKAQGVI
jgi:hypothetical protein